VTTSYRGDGYTVEIHRDVIRVESVGHYELADGWSHTDTHGHVHTSLDTLELVVVGTYWCETCNDEHEELEYRCRQCGDVVEPDWVFKGPDSALVPGLLEMILKLDDGREYMLRGDELTTEFPLSAEWLARVTAREPDVWRVSG
jgi:hypothetical protein